MQGWGQVTHFHFINCYYYWAKSVVNSKWAKLGIFEDFWMNDWPNKHKNGDRQKDKIGKSSSILKKLSMLQYPGSIPELVDGTKVLHGPW